MKMQEIKSIVQGLKKWTVKNSPVILAGLGVAGLIGTAVAVAKGTVKATKIVEEHKKEELTKKEIVKLTWKCYIPSTIIAAGSIACIIGGTVQGQKRLAALSALYSMSEQALKEYQEKTKEVVGEKNAEKISDAVAKDRLERHCGSEDIVLDTGHGMTKFFDLWTGRYFRSDIDFVKRMVNEANSAIIHGDSMALNEWYAWLDLPLVQAQAGDDIGWDCSELIEINYRAVLDKNDEPCVMLEYKTPPKGLWYNQ